MFVDLFIALVLVLIGFVMAYRSVRYSDLVVELVNKSLFYIAIPVVIFGTIYAAEDLYKFSISIAVSLTHIVLLFLAAYATYRLLQSNNMRRVDRTAAFTLSVAMPNAAYLAIPLSIVLLGGSKPVIPYTIAFNVMLPITILFLSLRYGGEDKYVSVVLKAAPFLLAFLLALIMRTLHVELQNIASVLKAVSTYTISSFVLIGYELAKSSSFLSRRLIKELFAAAILRYAISPIVMVSLIIVFNSFEYFDGLILQSVMPPAVSNIIIAKMFNLNTALVTVLISVLTPLSIAVAFALRCLVI